MNYMDWNRSDSLGESHKICLINRLHPLGIQVKEKHRRIYLIWIFGVGGPRQRLMGNLQLGSPTARFCRLLLKGGEQNSHYSHLILQYPQPIKSQSSSEVLFTRTVHPIVSLD